MARTVELRSDTFTRPTDSMWRAMAAAELGDDVWGEDPTINRLEVLAAQMVGKEASLFVPSGSMGNLCAILSQTQPGDEVIVESDSHIYNAELASGAVIGGVQMRPLETRDGRLDPAQVKAAIRDPDPNDPRTGLLCLENTHNMKGGTCLSPRQTEALADVAHRAGVRVHLDGARIFNASVAQAVDVRELTGPVDSVMFCLSKGLSAPVGSMLAGSRAFVDRARRMRKMLGGGMRQAGVLAAAGICALTENVERLAEDHANALELARGLQGLPGISVDLGRVETNLVFVHLVAPLTRERFLALCLERGIKVDPNRPTTVRLVTHRNVSKEDIAYAVAGIGQALRSEALQAVS
jgi:threonine aldolase